VGFVELLPVAAFPGRVGWGYDGVALYAVHEPYGGPEGLKRFVDACHARGLGVFLDVVLNHLGPDGNYLSRFGPYFTEAHHTPWGEAVNLDQRGAAEVRGFLAGVCRHWYEHYHVDGIRLDATDQLHDRSAIVFLEELAAAKDEWAAHLGRTLLLVAENDRNDARLVASREAGGFGLDAWWADDLHHALHAWLTGERASYYEPFGDPRQVAAALERGQVYDGRLHPRWDRVHGRSADHLPAHRLVTCAQNHDQVGNRARGERLGHLAGIDGALAAATVSLLAPTTPLLFMGEEWAASTPFPYVSDHQDPELAEAVRVGRRTEFAAFGWDPDQVLDPQDPVTHQLGVLRWDERLHQPHADVLAWYRTLLRLRADLPELTDGHFDRVVTEVIGEGEEAALVLRRGRVVAIVNRAVHPVAAAVPDGAAVLLGPGRVDPAEHLVHVPGRSAVVCGPPICSPTPSDSSSAP
jgi:maltooligosyltrehalose trehalohydrolase